MTDPRPVSAVLRCLWESAGRPRGTDARGTQCRRLRAVQVASLWAAFMLLSATAPADPIAITEEELYDYMAHVFGAMQRCDAGWLDQQFLATSRIRFINARGQAAEFSPQDYLQMFRKGCAPNKYMSWDQTSREVSIGSDVATMRWQLWWGGAEGERSKLVIHDRTDVVRRDRHLRILTIEDRTEELAPGAEQEYWVASRRDDMIDAALRLYWGVLDVFQMKGHGWWERKRVP